MADTDATICGNPAGPGARLIASRLRSRPLTDSRRLLATTKCSRRPKKLERWKKLPWKVKVKGSIGKPDGPTPAPGGSVAAGAAAPEGDGVLPAALEPVALVDGEEGVDGAGVVVTGPEAAGLSVRPRKSTRAPEAADWIS